MAEFIQEARRASVHSVNAIMTATYWEVGRRVVEVEQKGEEKKQGMEKSLCKIYRHI